jgi:centromere protein S
MLREVNNGTVEEVVGTMVTRAPNAFKASRLHLSNSITSTIFRLNMAGQDDDDNTKEVKLKAALWYSIGQTIDSVAVAQDINATPHFIGGLSEMVWGQIQNVAQDLEAFAKHNGRTTINTKDVLLLSRRNEGLAEHLSHHAKTVSAGDTKSNSR